MSADSRTNVSTGGVPAPRANIGVVGSLFVGKDSTHLLFGDGLHLDDRPLPPRMASSS